MKKYFLFLSKALHLIQEFDVSQIYVYDFEECELQQYTECNASNDN